MRLRATNDCYAGRRRRWGARARRVAALHVIPSFAAASLVHAQVTARSTGEELGRVFEDLAQVWLSPVRADTRDWVAAGLVSAGFAALLPVDAQADRWIVSHPRAAVFGAVSPFRETTGALSRLATARQLVPISASLVLAGVLADRRALREAGYGCMTAWAASNTIRYSIYAVVSRARPSAAGGDPFRIHVPGGDWNQQSFFAGHTTNAFACVAFWSERFDLSLGEPLLYAGAAMTALARMADRRHWTSDTFMGVAVGLAIGRTIAARYGRREAAHAGAGVAPAPDRVRALGPPPVIILWRARF
jgi:membrane-associated phospholipid phosphatase